jgi:hypothetical protein
MNFIIRSLENNNTKKIIPIHLPAYLYYVNYFYLGLVLARILLFERFIFNYMYCEYNL